MERFELRRTIAAVPETVFDLSRDIDAHVGSMADSGERAIRGVTRGLIGLDEEVTWRAKHFGVPFTMTSRIVEFERPQRFVDEQVSGPFRHFRHEHRFEATEDGTLMIDRVEFVAPFGLLGRLVERALLGGDLRRLIEQRNEYLQRAAESP